MMHSGPVWPTELKLTKKGTVLKVAFDNGHAFELPAEYLRVLSPSAEVKGHSRAERKVVAGKRDVTIVGVDPIGTYAVKLVFDDMHATGIYTWAYLHELGSNYDEKWGAYLAEVEAKGLSRDREGEAIAENARPMTTDLPQAGSSGALRSGHPPFRRTNA